MTGLSINPSKTQIFTLYCDANNLPKEHNNFLKKLGQTTNSAIHLGLIVEKSWCDSAKASWDKTLVSLKLSGEKFLNSAGSENPIHRKQLVSSIIQSSYNHVARVHPLSLKKIEIIDKMTRNLIWSKKIQTITYGRPKIAKKRLSDPLSNGGLGLKTTHDQIFLSLLSGAFNILSYCIEFPQSFMAKKINFDEFRFCQSGSKNLEYVQLIVNRIFPSLNETEGLNFFSNLTNLSIN